MARIRTIKPEMWADEKLGPCDPLTRLVFLGLISHADDAGRLVDSVRQLDGLLFPYTEDTCAEALDTLARLSRIRRYSSESGQRIIQIVGWERHQRVDKPSRHVLPPPPPESVVPQASGESSRDTPEPVATSSRSDHGPRTMDLGPEQTRPKPEPPVSDLWATWLEEFAGQGRPPTLTKQRRLVLAKLWLEQLRKTPDPMTAFRAVLRAVKRSDHHMSKREYQYPESLFRSEERRDRWAQAGLNGGPAHEEAVPFGNGAARIVR